MAYLDTALHQLRQERTLAQRQVQNLDEAINVIEGLVGGRGTREVSQPKSTLSAGAPPMMKQRCEMRLAKNKTSSRFVPRAHQRY
jgi:hypothetical protein